MADKTVSSKYTAEQLNNAMREQYSYIHYDKKHAEEFVNTFPIMDGQDLDTVAWLFADYLASQDLTDEIEL